MLQKREQFCALDVVVYLLNTRIYVKKDAQMFKFEYSFRFFFIVVVVDVFMKDVIYFHCGNTPKGYHSDTCYTKGSFNYVSLIISEF